MRENIENVIREDAAGDSDFRAALLADPATALTERYGAAIPAGLSLRVVEEAADEVILVLPSNDLASQLSESDLDVATGASDYGVTNNHCH